MSETLNITENVNKRTKILSIETKITKDKQFLRGSILKCRVFVSEDVRLDCVNFNHKKISCSIYLFLSHLKKNTATQVLYEENDYRHFT